LGLRGEVLGGVVLELLVNSSWLASWFVSCVLLCVAVSILSIWMMLGIDGSGLLLLLLFAVVVMLFVVFVRSVLLDLLGLGLLAFWFVFVHVADVVLSVLCCVWCVSVLDDGCFWSM
jgi:hypothetical protein